MSEAELAVLEGRLDDMQVQLETVRTEVTAALTEIRNDMRDVLQAETVRRAALDQRREDRKDVVVQFMTTQIAAVCAVLLTRTGVLVMGGLVLAAMLLVTGYGAEVMDLTWSMAERFHLIDSRPTPELAAPGLEDEA